MGRIIQRAFLSRVALILPLLLAAGCSGDDPATPSDGNTPPEPGHGVFVDSPVSGLEFTSGDETGVTGSTGAFTFEEGTDVTFALGGILFGSASASTKMSPLNLANATIVGHPLVTSIARFLQTIDDDADPSNGIQITETVRTAAIGRSVEFAQTPDEFDADPNVITVVAALTALTGAGERTLVPAVDARNQLTAGLRAAYAGDYSGTYCRDTGTYQAQGGTWTMHVTADGAVDMTFTGTPAFQAAGTMTITGDISIAILDGPRVYAGFRPDFSGRWYLGDQSGLFSQSVRCVN